MAATREPAHAGPAPAAGAQEEGLPDGASEEHLAAIVEALAVLDGPDEASTQTSMRLPRRLREATKLAAELGIVPDNVSGVATSALEEDLRSRLRLAAMDEMIELAPRRATLLERAIICAALDGSPLCEREDLLAHAVEEVAARHPDPTPEQVVLWAEATEAARAA